MAKETKENAPATIAPRIIVDVNDSTPFYYANYMEVSNTANDFSLFCARLPAKLSADKMKEIQALKTLHVDAEVQVVIPVSLIPPLIQALIKQKDVYENRIGQKIQEPGAGT
jgi:hypothetical protein